MKSYSASLVFLVLLVAGSVSCSGNSNGPTNAQGGNQGTGGLPSTGGYVATGGTPLTCSTGYTPCDNACVDTGTNASHCGACGMACPAGQNCVTGQCVCPSGLLACPAGCVDPMLSPTNCGACGVTCAVGQSCVNGACSCQAGLTVCGTACVNMTTDANNCGGCGVVCSGATPLCSQGHCTDQCEGGLTSCGSSCVNTLTDIFNCGGCGVQCAANETCVNGGCSCPSGQLDCGNGCEDVLTNVANCGSCGIACGSGATCVGGVCSCPTGSVSCDGVCVVGTSCPDTCNPACTGGKICSANVCVCPAGTEDCNGTCVTAGTCTTACNPACTGGKSCVNGACVCDAGLEDCSGTCANLQTSATDCGACGHACTGGQTCNAGTCACPAGTVDCDGECVTGTTCGTTGDRPIGMISDFEEGSGVTPPVVIAQDGRQGEWERFYETDTSNFQLAVESSGASDSGGQWALHATGASAAGWGDWVGIGFNLTGTIDNPNIYNASKYTGIRFRARIGAGHDAKSAVRFNISIPETEGVDSPGDHDACEPIAATTEQAARDCYQHLGRFLQVVPGYDRSDYHDNELTAEWKTFSYCFDRDLYPLSLPGNLSNAERNALPSRILKVQFQFNQGKDWYVDNYPNEGKYVALAKNLPFDFWLDDVEFFEGECPNSAVFASSGNAKAPFPQNANIGSCSPAANAANFANAISQIYARWTKNFVRDDGGNARVIAPEQENGVTTSESMGYGMLIAAAMGDKTNFDRFWGYVQAHMANGLMIWKPSGSGSATDGDVDIAYALLMADAQWGGYSSAASSMISAIQSRDVESNQLKAGDSWNPGFNPSYFAPSYFQTFGGMSTVISTNYGVLSTNVNAQTGRFPTDWTDWSGTPVTGDSIGAQVTAGFNVPVYGYDAARVPWRIGLDGCQNGGTGTTLATAIVDYFAQRYDGGATIDLMKAGWVKSSGAASTSSQGGTDARDFQGSFIGPLGVGAMAAGNTTVRDRAFRTILDIMENGDFNHTYFPSTVGFLTLLAMSGNFPAP